MLARLFICLALSAVAASAFVVSPAPRLQTALATKKWLDAVDEMCVENAADYCLDDDDQCDVETKIALINQLQDQRDLMAQKVNGIDSLIDRLKTSNAVISKKDKAHLDDLMGSMQDALHM